MANTYEAIAKSVLTSDTATVTFTSIPATFTDLLVLWTARGDSTWEANSGNSIGLRINSVSTGGTYSGTRLHGYNTTVASDRFANENSYITLYDATNVASETASTFTNGKLYISNYTASIYKPVSSTVVEEKNSGTNHLTVQTSLWSSTAAITSLTFMSVYLTTGKLIAGSSFYLYGIKST
jgi:hypothetical protein